MKKKKGLFGKLKFSGKKHETLKDHKKQAKGDEAAPTSPKSTPVTPTGDSSDQNDEKKEEASEQEKTAQTEEQSQVSPDDSTPGTAAAAVEKEEKTEEVIESPRKAKGKSKWGFAKFKRGGSDHSGDTHEVQQTEKSAPASFLGVIPYVPCADLKVSLEFYEKIGFVARSSPAQRQSSKFEFVSQGGQTICLVESETLAKETASSDQTQAKESEPSTPFRFTMQIDSPLHYYTSLKGKGLKPLPLSSEEDAPKVQQEEAKEGKGAKEASDSEEKGTDKSKEESEESKKDQKDEAEGDEDKEAEDGPEPASPSREETDPRNGFVLFDPSHVMITVVKSPTTVTTPK